MSTNKSYDVTDLSEPHFGKARREGGTNELIHYVIAHNLAEQ
jgi:hypothetical protein